MSHDEDPRGRPGTYRPEQDAAGQYPSADGQSPRQAHYPQHAHPDQRTQPGASHDQSGHYPTYPTGHDAQQAQQGHPRGYGPAEQAPSYNGFGHEPGFGSAQPSPYGAQPQETSGYVDPNGIPADPYAPRFGHFDPTSAAHQAGHRPAQDYASGQDAAGQYTAGQYPAGQYPAGQYAGSQYAPAHHPGSVNQPSPDYPAAYPPLPGHGRADAAPGLPAHDPAPAEPQDLRGPQFEDWPGTPGAHGTQVAYGRGQNPEAYPETGRGDAPSADPGFYSSGADAARGQHNPPVSDQGYAQHAGFGFEAGQAEQSAQDQGFQGHHQGYDEGYATSYASSAGYGASPTLAGTPGPAGLQLDPGLQYAPVEQSGTSLDAGYDEYEHEDTSPPASSGSRMFLIAGALVGAIAIGGGLAYGYKLMFGSGAEVASGKPPIVRGPASATKTRPDDPGGKQFANTNSKIMDRLGGSSSSSNAAANAPRNADGTRRVQTISVGRDGTAGAAGRGPPASSAPANPVVTVPGLTVVDTFANVRSAPAAPRPSGTDRTTTGSNAPSSRSASSPLNPARPASPLVVKPPPAATASKPSPSRPIVVANTRTVNPASTRSSRPITASTDSFVDTGATQVNPITGRAVKVPAPFSKSDADIPAAWRSRPAVRPATSSDVNAFAALSGRSSSGAAPAAAASRDPGDSGARSSVGASLGYVVVLASVPASSTSRMEALTRFADLQQTYSTVLSNKTPDVREANLGSRGRYHRLLVGPPGSKEQANSLCSKLKSSGYSGCWVTAF